MSARRFNLAPVGAATGGATLVGRTAGATLGDGTVGGVGVDCTMGGGALAGVRAVISYIGDADFTVVPSSGRSGGSGAEVTLAGAGGGAMSTGASE